MTSSDKYSDSENWDLDWESSNIRHGGVGLCRSSRSKGAGFSRIYGSRSSNSVRCAGKSRGAGGSGHAGRCRIVVNPGNRDNHDMSAHDIDGGSSQLEVMDDCFNDNVYLHDIVDPFDEGVDSLNLQDLNENLVICDSVRKARRSRGRVRGAISRGELCHVQSSAGDTSGVKNWIFQTEKTGCIKYLSRDNWTKRNTFLLFLTTKCSTPW